MLAISASCTLGNHTRGSLDVSISCMPQHLYLFFLPPTLQLQKCSHTSSSILIMSICMYYWLQLGVNNSVYAIIPVLWNQRSWVHQKTALKICTPLNNHLIHYSELVSLYFLFAVQYIPGASEVMQWHLVQFNLSILHNVKSVTRKKWKKAKRGLEGMVWWL